MVEQLQAFFDNASILDPFQSGFYPGCGMEITLVALMDDLWRHLNWGRLVLAVAFRYNNRVQYTQLQPFDPPSCDTGKQGSDLQWVFFPFSVARDRECSLGSDCLSGILSPVFNISMHPLIQLVWGYGLGCHQYADGTQLCWGTDGLFPRCFGQGNTGYGWMVATELAEASKDGCPAAIHSYQQFILAMPILWDIKLVEYRIPNTIS